MCSYWHWHSQPVATRGSPVVQVGVFANRCSYEMRWWMTMNALVRYPPSSIVSPCRPSSRSHLIVASETIRLGPSFSLRIEIETKVMSLAGSRLNHVSLIPIVSLCPKKQTELMAVCLFTYWRSLCKSWELLSDEVDHMWEFVGAVCVRSTTFASSRSRTPRYRRRKNWDSCLSFEMVSVEFAFALQS